MPLTFHYFFSFGHLYKKLSNSLLDAPSLAILYKYLSFSTCELLFKYARINSIIIIANKMKKLCLLCESPKWNSKVSLIGIVRFVNKALKNSFLSGNRSRKVSRFVIESSNMDAANLEQKVTSPVSLLTLGQNLTIKSKLTQT